MPINFNLGKVVTKINGNYVSNIIASEPLIWDQNGSTVTISASSATQSSSGLMTAIDKTKLDGIQSNAVTLGETSSTAYRGDRGKTAYDHTSLTNNPHQVTKVQIGLGNVDNTSDLDKPVSTATQGALGDKVDKVTGKGLSTNDFTDTLKNKLDGIASEANKYIHPSYTSKSSGLYKITVDGTGHISGATAVTKSDITGLGIPAQDTTYSFSNKSATLAWGTTSTIATVGGTDITLTMPANPNTNTWRGVQNNLTSTATDQSLAASQGPVIGKAIKSITRSGTTFTYTCLDGTTGTFTQQDNNTTYNFAGTAFNSGKQDSGEHNANSMITNGHYYYTSNGPATSLGASTNDGGMYVQGYNDTWAGQIAQDYRNGNIFVRGKNNGTWTSWKKPDAGTINGLTVQTAVPANAKFTDTTYTFTNKGATLAWNTTSTIATVGGVDIKVTMPANPNTWRGIQNNLTSTATDQSLSAEQGRLLANGSARDSSKLPLAGGTLTGDLLFSNSGTAIRQIRLQCGDNDYGRIAVGATAANAGWMEIATADDANEPIYVRQYNSGTYGTIVRTATLLDASGNTSFPGSLNVVGAIKQNGTAVSLSGHTHSYLPLSGGSITGKITYTSPGGTSYIAGSGGNAGFWAKKKAINTDEWSPAMAIQTKAGGGWAIGNYNNEYLQFSYGTKANIDAGTNSTKIINFTDDGGANFPGTIKQNGTAVSLAGHTHDYIPLSGWTVNGSQGWGNQTGTFIKGFGDSTGGSIAWRRDNPASGQMSMIIDGTVYIKEGAVNVGDAIKSITRNGTTFTYTTLWGNTGTFTQQDNNTTYSFSDKNATLAWGTKSTIATTGGTDIHVTMPANPNTDTFKTTKSFPIAKLADDTRANWVTAGNGFFWCTTSGIMNGQPTQWGFVLNIVMGADVHQIFYPQTSGRQYYRGGNGSTTAMPAWAPENTDTNTTYTFTNKGATLAWNTAVTIATVGGVNITATLPANPNTNTWRGVQNNLTSTATDQSLAASQGPVIAKAIKSITRSGTTFTYTCLDGTTGTFTQQDNNTTYGVASASTNGLMSATDFKKINPQRMPDNSNFNNFTTTGWYYCETDASTKTMTNRPCDYAFFMEVYPFAGQYQHVIRYNDCTHYDRRLYNGAWTAWREWKLTDNNTLNTAGSTNTTSKIFLVGATSQAANPQTYSNSSCYASGGYLYSGGTKVSVEGHTHSYAASSHNHDAGNITSGTLAIARGGTGNSTGRVTAGRKSSTTLGTNATAEGTNTTASFNSAHAEGYETTACADYTHAEGYSSTADGSGSHAEGYKTEAGGVYSHAEGLTVVAEGQASHAEGMMTYAQGNYSHAEGASTTASAIYSHAEGNSTTASATCSHAEGISTTAKGSYSHAEGYSTTANSSYSHAGGYNTTASAESQTVIGAYNVNNTTQANAWFIVGKGTSSARANAFRVGSSGVWGAGAYNSSGADYAEMFEWLDGNPNNEDRVGRFVTLDGSKIRFATPEDDYILGIISGFPTVLGDVYDDQWSGMYESDIYGRPIYEDVEVPAETRTEVDPETGEEKEVVIREAHTEYRQKVNPNYDFSVKYIPRSERPEWDAVGLIGKLVCQDDGTSEVNGYVKPSVNGIATKSTERTRYRVMERIDDNHIRIYISPCA